MTCRAVRLRLLPWVWERLGFPPSHNWLYAEAISMNKLGKTIVSALHTGGSLATSVRYFYVLGFVPGLGADPCPLVKVHEGVPSVWTHPLFVTCSSNV